MAMTLRMARLVSDSSANKMSLVFEPVPSAEPLGTVRLAYS
jgi:hypothetical protein